MFSERTSTRKPGNELLAHFRQQFPEVSARAAASPPGISQTAGEDGSALVPVIIQPGSKFQDQDPTPRANNEMWRFTPSLLDSDSFADHFSLNPATGAFMPNIRGTSPMLHSQAGQQQSQSTGVMQGMTMPFSRSVEAEALFCPGSMDMASFRDMPLQMSGVHPFPMPDHRFGPTSSVHQDPGYETVGNDGAEMADYKGNMIAAAIPRHGTALHLLVPLPATAERFRFHSTLNAPTAMIKYVDEIPITYLNKGQAYTLSVVDTGARLPLQRGTKYRTFVRVSFEDDEQRANPGVCWRLWKEGRGTSEAHQRGGKMQAVEFVEGRRVPMGDGMRACVEVESASFDGFCVTWAPGAVGAPELNINVRFNFLSTDFSHSKGVKGIPVRLCVKTTIVSVDPNEPACEVCFCKVKLFRDHGAERKISIDVAHVMKSIEKLKQQILDAESRLKLTQRKQQSMASVESNDLQKADKAPKHKRTRSMSLTSSASALKKTVDEDLHFRLQTIQDMFNSTRPVSILFLRGEKGDDPDLAPVSLPSVLSPATRDERQWQARGGQSSTHSFPMSPSLSSLSLASQTSGQQQNFDFNVTAVDKTDHAGTLRNWIEALGVDASYHPPQEQGLKPVACFYVLCSDDKADSDRRDYHRAVYVGQRTLEDFNRQVASKWGLDASKVQRTIRVLPNGLEVEMDDDVIRELREGQDMHLNIVNRGINTHGAMEVDGDGYSSGIILRFTF